MKTPRKPKKKFTVATTKARNFWFIPDFKTTLLSASFFAIGLLTSCGDLGGNPAADGHRFYESFYYYYVQTCRYDKIGVYGCDKADAVSPAVRVSLRVDSDGFASLNWDGNSYYYMESEYEEDYDPDFGSYFLFHENDGDVTLYKDGSVLAFWDDWNTVTFYYSSFDFVIYE
jgi:hypothetical protein